MSQPLVSIIVPVYNAEKYLEKCITSILNQSYRKLQIILVNDGSTDKSLVICTAYSKKDKRICVVNQENRGVVGARKSGVEVAEGEFICWVDADDWIEEEYISRLIIMQEETAADIVAVAHFHDIGKDSTIVKNGISKGLYDSSQLVQNMLYTGAFFEYGITPQLYTKLFCARILKETQMAVRDNIIAGDDAATVYPSILKAKKVYVSDYAGYHYVQNVGSITKVLFADEKERVLTLIDYLKEAFRKAGVLEQMEKQVHAYQNYLLMLRQIESFDIKGGANILVPFGGFNKEDRIIIYGAGVLGQNIYKYLVKEKEVCIVDWLDKNYETYRQNGFEVNSPNNVKEFEGKFDYIVIANITQKTAFAIKEFLLSEGVQEKSIRWIAKEFRPE